ncbi:MAG: hypothetical protein KKE50_04580 [Nanoarchaeota archaeon]|nr:hypothetical protein [Nanoarchaeota archaeon]
MKNKKEARINLKLLLVGILLISLIGFIFAVSALTSDDKTALQNELNNLTLKLSSQGYDWLVDKTIDYNSINDSSKVEVYRENGNDSLAVFDNLNGEMNKILLTNLGDNESYDVFDLKSVGDVGRINGNILLMKKRIDEIRGVLNSQINLKGELS